MKLDRISPFINFYWKVIGLFLIILSMIAILLAGLLEVSEPQVNGLISAAALVGLFLIVFSKERNETEKIIYIRNTAFRISYCTTAVYFILFTIDEFLHPELSISTIFGSIVFFISFLIPYYTIKLFFGKRIKIVEKN